MSKRHEKIAEELDIHSVTEFTTAYKNYYTSMGYRPYRTENGKIKWLALDQHSLRIHAGKKRHFIKRLFFAKPIPRVRVRKHRHPIIRFIRYYWGFVSLFILLTAFVLVLLLYPQLIM